MRPPLDPDGALLARARRTVAARTALAVAAALLAVGALALWSVVRAQSAAANAALRESVVDDDDVRDPPPGIWVFIRGGPHGSSSTPGAPAGLPDQAALAAAATGAPVTVNHYRAGRRHFLVRTIRRDGAVVQAALDLADGAAERNRLLAGLAVAELTGLAAAALVGGLLAGRAIAPLGEALALQRRFVADASHELRSPLTLLHTRAQLLDRELRAGAPAEQTRTEAAALVADSRRLADVVDDLLLAAERGQRPDRHYPVRLDAVATDVVNAAAALAAQRGVDLRLLITAGPVAATAPVPAVLAPVPAVLGAEPALRRVLASLVDNALGHTVSGGHVLVTVRTIASPKGNRTAKADRVEVAVNDDGVGLDPATAHRLFDRFARGTDGDGRRFGLGLSLVREVVTAHGGTVAVSGAPGHGATFTVTLPVLAT